jgi:HIV Tat-specific factor 1
LIAEEIDSDKPRIKMYEDSEGKFKGDALVVYFKPESVALAIQLLDESEFRWGSKGPDGLMRVKEADTSYKKQKNEAGQNVGVTGGTAPVKKRGKKGDKQKIIEKTMRLNQRLADWSEDEDGGALLNKEVKKEVKKVSKWDKVVILKHMFTLDGLAQEIREDPQAKEYLLEDTKEKCEEFGEVLDLFIFDLEQEGVMTVRFAKAEDAAMCAQKLNGWRFDGRTVEASISTGQRFRKSQLSAEDEEAERRRLNAFAEALENAPDE